MSAPYFASKHASYAIARILHDQLKSSQIRISAVCPGAVMTPLLESLRRGMREAAARGTLPNDRRVDPDRKTLGPTQVAAAVFNSIGTTQTHVIMNPEYRSLFEMHVDSVLSEWPAAPPAGSPRR
jgi:NAD(P)-dependent dehydrogenase (short-subunit alcohol dehydrogenase family)